MIQQTIVRQVSSWFFMRLVLAVLVSWGSITTANIFLKIFRVLNWWLDGLDALGCTLTALTCIDGVHGRFSVGIL